MRWDRSSSQCCGASYWRSRFFLLKYGGHHLLHFLSYNYFLSFSRSFNHDLWSCVWNYILLFLCFCLTGAAILLWKDSVNPLSNYFFCALGFFQCKYLNKFWTQIITFSVLDPSWPSVFGYIYLISCPTTILDLHLVVDANPHSSFATLQWHFLSKI